MEKKENNEKGILIGVLVAIIIVLAGLCIYYAFIKKDNDNNVTINDICPKCEECTSQDDLQEDCNCPQCQECEKCENNNSFNKYKTGIVNSIKNSKNDVFKSEIFEYKDGHYIVALTKEMNLVLRKNNAYYDNKASNIDYTIKSNVIDFFLVPGRQSGLAEIYYINSDGTLERFSPISYIDEQKVNIEKNSTYKNIISVIRGSGCRNCKGETDIEPYFVDINGNVYSNVYNYWK